jgi:hypothetical protein
MNAINELRRLPSPAPRPQPIAFDGDTLWMGSWDTQRLYAIDTHKWTVQEEAPAPGRPFGMTMLGDELRVILGMDDDDRYIYRFIPGHGFKPWNASPDLSGAHLAFDGDTIYVSQLGNKRILSLDSTGKVTRTIPLERGACGMTIVDGCFYLITGDDELEDLRFTKLDARGKDVVVTDLASVPFDARALAYDGSRFWTCHRDNHEIVAFSV